MTDTSPDLTERLATVEKAILSLSERVFSTEKLPEIAEAEPEAE
jgi:hypothetical protein